VLVVVLRMKNLLIMLNTRENYIKKMIMTIKIKNRLFFLF